MLEHLTPEMEAQIPGFVENKIAQYLKPTNKTNVRKLVNHIYKESGVLNNDDGTKRKLKIYFADSPKAAQKKANEIAYPMLVKEFPDMKKGEIRKRFPWGSYGDISDCGWVSHYQFLNDVCGVDVSEDFKKYNKLHQNSNAFLMIQMRAHCIVVNMPTEIYRNTEGRLHKTDGPAIVFKDGEEYYFLKGVNIPKNVFMDAIVNRTMTAKDVLSLDNAEWKSHIIEVLGFEFIMDDLKATLLDEDKKNKIWLYEFEMDGNTFKLLKFLDWSDNKSAFQLCGDRNARTVNDAMLWVYNLGSDGKYNPKVQT